ncbi:MAG: hypothetical protein ACFFCQ_13180 [Promethearchaeota archaeon]
MAGFPIPVCKNCRNYIMKLDEDNPCPHCGNKLTLTDRNDGEIKPIIPEEFQADFTKPLDLSERSLSDIDPFYLQAQKQTQTPTQDYNYNEPICSTPLKLRQDLPLEAVLPPSLPDVPLTATEQKVYLQLSVEFHIIMDRAENYRTGLYNWNLILPERLQEYGLTNDAWERIAAIGDNDEKLQRQLNDLLQRLK